MHYRRVASFVLGAWIACSILTVLVTIQFRHVDDLLRLPPPDVQKLIGSFKAEDAHALLRYEAWMQVRWLSIGWGIAQIPLALVTAWLLLLSTRISKIGVGAVFAMLTLACFAQFVVAPEFTYIGRALDIGSAKLGGRGRYFLLYGLYLVLDGLKVALACGLAAYLFFYRSHKHEELAQAAAAPVNSIAAPMPDRRRLGFDR